MMHTSRRSHMFDSPESANLWFDVFNGILFTGAVLVTVGTYGTIKAGAAKERFSDERVAANEAETKRAIADSDVAKQGAAEASARAAEAQLALERFKAPRELTGEQLERIVSTLSKFAGQEYVVTTFWDLKEPLAFANILHHALQQAGWKFIPPTSATFMLGGIAGVQVWVHPMAKQPVRDAANAVVAALNAEQIEATLKLQNPENPEDNKIGFNVGTKQ
jgi:Tfp pilus assembly protein PilX